MKITTKYETSDGRKFGEDEEAAKKHQRELDEIDAFLDAVGAKTPRGRAAVVVMILAWNAWTASEEAFDADSE